MNKNQDAHSKEFLVEQKARLIKLRDELQGELIGVANDENQQDLINSEAREYEDDAQKLDALERDGVQERRHTARLETVNRALAKIDDGTYGVSIVSGKKISEARLEAVPEALWNVDEEPSAS